MAHQFKIGDRVRLRKDADADEVSKRYLGMETTIIGVYQGDDRYWALALYGAYGLPVCALPVALEPILDDPSADAFLSRLKKLGREPVIPLHTVPFGD